MPVALTLNQLFTNNAVSLLTAPLSPLSTSLTVIPGHGALFPQPTGDGSDYFLITLEDQAATIREIIKVTGRAGDTLTFSLADRALEAAAGVTHVPLAWTAGVGGETLVDHRVTAETLDRLQRLPALDTINSFGDVDTVTSPPTAGQVLKWNGLTWAPGTDISGGAGSQELYVENPVTPSPPAALGLNSIAIGQGAQVEPTAHDAMALGQQAVARHIGSQVYANGRFGGSGDVQNGKYLLRNVTTSIVPVELFLDGAGGSARLTLIDDSTWTFKITVTAHRTDVGNGHAGYTFTGVIYRGAGAASTAFQGRPIKSVIAESNPQWDVNIIRST
jgi:Head domain of trimeric autotransporter adhesin